MAECEDEMVPGAAAERAFDPEEDPAVGPEPEPDSVIRFEIPGREIPDPRGDFSGVVENGSVYGREDLPSVLGLQQQQVSIAEPELVEPSKVFVSTKGAQEIERHF